MGYISYICSKYHGWFQELGYPTLDINEYSDGSWDIIYYENSPVIPSLCRYRTVLGNMKNIEPSYGFVAKYIDEIDTHKKRLWAREEEKTRRVYQEQAAKERHAADSASKAFEAMRRNPDLMERIAKNGLSEMNIDRIYRNIPRSQRRGLK